MWWVNIFTYASTVRFIVFSCPNSRIFMFKIHTKSVEREEYELLHTWRFQINVKIHFQVESMFYRNAEHRTMPCVRPYCICNLIQIPKKSCNARPHYIVPGVLYAETSILILVYSQFAFLYSANIFYSGICGLANRFVRGEKL